MRTYAKGVIAGSSARLTAPFSLTESRQPSTRCAQSFAMSNFLATMRHLNPNSTVGLGVGKCHYGHPI
jgi:hypothetical protein